MGTASTDLSGQENIQHPHLRRVGGSLSEYHGQVFGGGGGSRRVFPVNSVVVPFRPGRTLINPARGKPVNAIKILPNGINVQRPAEAGVETASVYGDVVRPQ